MFCPKCGKINPDNAEICSGCDAPLHEENSAAPVKKSRKILKAIIAAAIVIAVVVVVVVLCTSCGNKPSASDGISF